MILAEIGRILNKSLVVAQYIALASLFLLAGVVSLSAFKVPGNIRTLSVLSGSMEPAIGKGSIIIIQPKPDYQIGDVITISEPSNPKVSLTHRVSDIKTEKGKTAYVTKGDANDTPDLELRPKSSVLGKVIFTIPLFGYITNFGKTREGLIFLIIVPATLIIYSELLTIKKEVVRILKNKRIKKPYSDNLESDSSLKNKIETPNFNVSDSKVQGI